ncbi:hypothetical protein H2198_009402 [Neophaeococcomyces mojaviensis]|uniref:Uncharacterized protein n=1 Tax=Neophaeococcomyces mojaviensis TaxID=3383035 RepID=A0ACC2ZUP7_9EURO|nr:hypothetical protein H2198_009402 [Knufia sp. JES_112]
MPQRIAVIGAGPLGLMAAKNLKEDGFDVTGYESRPYVGGLWKDSEDSTISVHATTIFNSSKFRAAASDFPFAESDDVYPTAAQIHAYFNRYADHFKLRPHLHLSTRVNQILRGENCWTLQIEDLETNTSRVESYDRICVATGSFYTPRFPTLEGLENFNGRVLHSIDFHGSEPFKDQNVLLVGMHATAQDITNSLSKTAQHVYLSHRSGLLMLPRFNEDGTPFDTSMTLPLFFFQTFAETWFPRIWTGLLDNILGKISDKVFPTKKEWKLNPKPSIGAATPLMADTIYPFMQSGFAEPVAKVRRITGPKAVELEDGRVLDGIDSIIYCTGYHFNMPESLIPRSGEKAEAYDPYPNGPGPHPRLYRNCFPLHPDPAIRNSLAFLGQGAVTFPGFSQFELMAMCVSQIWRGNAKLPPYKEMVEWYDENTRWREQHMKRHNQRADSTFYPAFLQFAPQMHWMHETAGTGIYSNLDGLFNGTFNWRAWKLWWADGEMYKLCTKGLFTPTMLRLFGSTEGKGGRRALGWEECRRRMREENEAWKRASEKRREEMEREKK